MAKEIKKERLQSERQTRNMLKELKPILIAFSVGLLVLSIKIYAYMLTGSLALKSDALESVVNVVASAFAAFSLYYSLKPADNDHPFGHGKMEYFSSVFEGGLVFFAGIAIGYDVIKSSFAETQLQTLSFGLGINLFAGVLNGLLGIYLLRMGKKQNSVLLEAEGEHVLSDFKTTLAIAMALILVTFTGMAWIDPLIAGLMSLHFMWTGIRLVKKSSLLLLDTEDSTLLETISKKINEIQLPEIIDVHSLRTMRTGRSVHIHMHIAMPEYLDLSTCHGLLYQFEDALAQALAGHGEFHSHLDPCDRKYCARCTVTDCPIRILPFKNKPDVGVQQLTERGPVHHWKSGRGFES